MHAASSTTVPPRLTTVKAHARATGLSQSTVRRKIVRGELVGVRVGCGRGRLFVVNDTNADVAAILGHWQQAAGTRDPGELLTWLAEQAAKAMARPARPAPEHACFPTAD